MKTQILLAVFLFFVSFSLKSQNWLWAQSGGSVSGSEIAWGTTVDQAGNSYICGQFYLSTTFGAFTLTSAGAQDIFIVKYDVNGNVVWAKGIGGISTDLGFRIACDQAGNVFVNGNFNDVVNFGTTTLTSSGWDDVFLAKYDANGNEIWVKQGGGSDYFDNAGDLATDQQGNCYLSGSFGSSSADFGSNHFVNSSALAYQKDLFIIKYDPAGAILWTIHPAGLGTEGIARMSVASNGDVYVLGNFDNSITLGTASLTSLGSNDMLLMKYDSNGNFIFAKQMGGTNMDLPYGLSLDQSDQVFITGGFYGSISIGAFNLSSAANTNELFIAKLDQNGNELWAKQLAASGNCVGLALENDPQGNVLFACDFYGATSFAGQSFTSLGSEDVLMGKYSSNGTELWALQAGGSDFDEVRDMVLDQNGFIYACGRFRSTSNFDNVSLTCSGNEDAWIAKFQGPSTASLAEQTVSEQLIAPNPANTQINFAIAEDDFMILNSLGQIIYQGKGNSFITQALPNGIYYLQRENKQSKFMVQH